MTHTHTKKRTCVMWLPLCGENEIDWTARTTDTVALERYSGRVPCIRRAQRNVTYRKTTEAKVKGAPTRPITYE